MHAYIRCEETEMYENEVIKIISERFSGKKDSLRIMKKEPLLGTKIGIPPRELLLILRDIEDDFHVCFSASDLRRGCMSTIECICNTLEEYLTQPETGDL